MQGLHFDLKSHFLEVVPSDGGVFEHDPNVIILLELDFLDHFSSEYFTNGHQ